MKPSGGTWRPDDLDRLERAIVDGTRVLLFRRGTEYVVVPLELRSEGGDELLVGRTLIGENLEFALSEVESLQVLD